MSTLVVRSIALSIGALALLPSSAATLPPSVEQASEQREAQGNALFADGRFAAATSAYEQAVASEPRSANALAALARMRLYQHREDDAAALAQRAINLEPKNSLATQVLRTVDARRSAFGPDQFRVNRPGSASTNFVVTDPLPVVHVKIGGRDANFFIDTGAPNIALNRSLALSLGLALQSSGIGMFAGGLQAKVEKTVVPELELGGLRIANVPAAINPAELQLPGVHTEGVIGTGLLMHFLATIDYCRGRLFLDPRNSSSEFERTASRSGANVVPMWLVGDHLIFARAKMDGKEGLFSIDTGLAGGGLVATKAMIDAAGVKLDEKQAGTGQGGGGEVRGIPFRATASLGTLTRTNVAGVFMPDGDPYRIFPFKVAGALSHSFFRHSQVTFDFDGMKLITQRC